MKKEIAEQVYERDNGRCIVTGYDIYNPTSSNFAHVLPKGKNKFYHFAENVSNIVLVHYNIHHIYDHGTIEQIWNGIQSGQDWFCLIKKYNELYEEYSELYPNHGVGFKDYYQMINDYDEKCKG